MIRVGTCGHEQPHDVTSCIEASWPEGMMQAAASLYVELVLTEALQDRHHETNLQVFICRFFQLRFICRFFMVFSSFGKSMQNHADNDRVPRTTVGNVPRWHFVRAKLRSSWHCCRWVWLLSL